MSADLIVAQTCGRAVDQIGAAQDGVLSVCFFDGDKGFLRALYIARKFLNYGLSTVVSAKSEEKRSICSAGGTSSAGMRCCAEIVRRRMRRAGFAISS